jgi:hypothetical protein
MQRLAYKRYVSQGGDWGAIISEVMAVQAPKGLMGIHINMPGTVPPTVLRLIRNREPVPSSFSDAEKIAFAGLEYFYRKGFGYAEMMNTRPQTLGYALADSPVGMLAFFYDKFTEWTYGRDPEKALTRGEILDNVTLYWLTNTGTSSSRSYWDAAQGGSGPFNAVEITEVPVAVTIFPGEIYRAPRSWAEQTFHKLIYWNIYRRGNNRNCSRKSSAPRSDRYDNRSELNRACIAIFPIPHSATSHSTFLRDDAKCPTPTTPHQPGSFTPAGSNMPIDGLVPPAGHHSCFSSISAVGSTTGIRW